VSFRLYARSIDDVEGLRRFLANHNIDAYTSVYEIERVKSVDSGLTKIFWLVAVVGILGCAATLAASFASSIERKKRALGIMRLMGVSGWMIFQIPMSQAVLIGIAGFFTASVAFFAMANVINQLFGTDLPPGSGMCVLKPTHFVIALSATIIIVLLTSVFSAWNATRIDPADAMREE
jgi:putative ABC transport system permease protein